MFSITATRAVHIVRMAGFHGPQGQLGTRGLIDRGLERIVSIAQVGKDASERITSKPGMVDRSCNRPVRVHAITKGDYLSADPG